MRVVAAPDSFKGSISAASAAVAIAAGWRLVRPQDEVIELPLADGGEGTIAVLAAAVAASRRHERQVAGPGNGPVQASWLEIDGDTAVIELAAAAGLTQLTELRPLTAHSYGVGELIASALDAGARRITVALGGSACTDGGTGALAALGARFLDAGGAELPLGGGALRELAAVDLTALRPPPPGGVSCLTDVRAPLLGPGGAAAVFGPQKGASPADVVLLESGLRRLAGLLGGDPGQPGAGAAGGCGYGLAAAWGARLLPGAAELAVIAGLPQALAGADLVITGEGQYDATSESGKVVGAVRALAAAVKSQPQPGSGERDGGQVPGEPEAGVPGWGLPRAVGGPGSGERDGGQVPGEPESGAREADGGPAAGERGAGRPTGGVPVAIVAGQVAMSPPAGVRAVELAALAGGTQAAMADPARWLAEAGALLAASA